MKLANVSGLTKPAKLRSVIETAHRYIRTMQAGERVPARVVLANADYDAILRSVNAGLEQRDRFDGLRIGDVPLERGS